MTLAKTTKSNKGNVALLLSDITDLSPQTHIYVQSIKQQEGQNQVEKMHR